MKVAELKKAIGGYRTEQLRGLLVEMYKAMPKRVKEDHGIDDMICSPGSKRNNRKSEVVLAIRSKIRPRSELKARYLEIQERARAPDGSALGELKSATPMNTLRTNGVYSPTYASRSEPRQSTLDGGHQDPAVPFALPRTRRCLSEAV